MANRWRKRWLIVLFVMAGVLIAVGIAIWILNPRLTHYVESENFRHEMEKETARGLHFPSGQFAPIRRTGFLTAASDGFHATNGREVPLQPPRMPGPTVKNGYLARQQLCCWVWHPAPREISAIGRH